MNYSFFIGANFKKNVKMYRIMKKDIKKTLKRLVVEVDSDFHQELKVLAATRNISMKKVILRALTLWIVKEKSYKSEPV